MREIETILTADVCAAIRAPIEVARTLPRQAFTSEAFAEAERERVFANQWCALSFHELVANPGDVLPVDLAGMPLLLVRGEDATLRAFHNVVPYDGCPVALDPASGLREIVARYHGWRYDLEGKLLAIPYWAGDPKGADLDALGERPANLSPIALATWGPVVFVNVSGTAGSFADAIAPLANELQAWDVGDLRISRDGEGEPLLQAETLETNWKTHAENWGINVLHEAFVHAIYDRSTEVPRMRLDGTKSCDDHVDGRFLSLKYREDDFPTTYGDIPFPRLEQDPRIPIEHGYFGSFLPNLHIGVFANLVHLIISNPQGPTRTENQRAQFYKRTAATDPTLLNAREQLAAGFAIAGEEDGRITEAIQRARTSPAFESQYHSARWDEMHYRFSQWVLERITGDSA